MYLNYYKYNLVGSKNNLPIVFLLVTYKNKVLVENATAGMVQQIILEIIEKIKKIIEK